MLAVARLLNGQDNQRDDAHVRQLIGAAPLAAAMATARMELERARFSSREAPAPDSALVGASAAKARAENS